MRSIFFFLLVAIIAAAAGATTKSIPDERALIEEKQELDPITAIAAITAGIKAASLAIEVADQALTVIEENKDTIKMLLKPLEDIIKGAVKIGEKFFNFVGKTASGIVKGFKNLFGLNPPETVPEDDLPMSEREAEEEYMKKEEELEKLNIEACEKKQEIEIEKLLLDELEKLLSEVEADPDAYKDNGTPYDDAYFEARRKAIADAYVAEHGNCEETANADSGSSDSSASRSSSVAAGGNNNNNNYTPPYPGAKCRLRRRWL